MKSYNRIIIFVAILFSLLPDLNFAQVEKNNIQQESSSIIQAILDSVSIDSIYQTERHLTGEEPFWINGQLDSIKSRHTYGEGILKAQAYLQSRFEKMGYTVELQPFKVGSYVVNNLVVTKLGTVAPDHIFILCAHYDATSPLLIIEAPGADDNGSGTATIVEAARVLANTNFQFSIKFILFAGEEQGLYGSKFYAEQAFLNNEDIAGVVNLDMIGYDGNDDGVFEIHTGFELESQNIGNVVSANVTDLKLSLFPEIYATTESTTRSDHSSFWFRDYPAILIIEDFFDSLDQYPFYHSISDRLSKLNKNFFLDMARLSIVSLATLAGIDSIASDVTAAQVVPNEFKLFSPYPNPFNPSVTIEYQVSDYKNISVKIFDSLGRVVATLFDDNQNSGNHLITWNGLNSSGDLASSGIYFVTLQAGDFFEKQKIILMR